ncbi:hypothetical protein, partial [Proteus mirabilis]|uniref:hypothetical protein n=1 Tax=Proteus mirabilis TaxID=584 RepID=UPI003C6E2088
ARSSSIALAMGSVPISTRDYHKWVGEQGKPRYLLSLLGRKITSEHLERVTTLVASHGFNLE